MAEMWFAEQDKTGEWVIVERTAEYEVDVAYISEELHDAERIAKHICQMHNDKCKEESVAN